jgi:hypothetical protein
MNEDWVITAPNISMSSSWCALWQRGAYFLYPTLYALFSCYLLSQDVVLWRGVFQRTAETTAFLLTWRVSLEPSEEYSRGLHPMCE